jgi:hypothetical protein
MEMNGLVTAAIASPLPVRSGTFCTCTKIPLPEPKLRHLPGTNYDSLSLLGFELNPRSYCQASPF